MNHRSSILTSVALFFIILALVPLACAQIGTGMLYVYEDAAHTVEAPKESNGNNAYLTNIGTTYFIRIWGITEFNTGDLLTVKIGWTDTSDNGQTTEFNNIPVQETGGTKYLDVTWAIPTNGKFCTTATVHYTLKPGPDYVAQGQTSNTGHMHIIPDVLQGTIGVTIALFASYFIYELMKRRNRLRAKQALNPLLHF